MIEAVGDAALLDLGIVPGEIYSAFIYSGPAVLKEMARAMMQAPR